MRLLHVLLEVKTVPVSLVAHVALVGPNVLVVIEMTLVTLLAREALLAVFTLVQLLVILHMIALDVFLDFMICLKKLITERTGFGGRFMQ